MANNFKKRVGEKYMTKEGYEIEIIEYLKYEECTVRFNCGYTVSNQQYGAIKRGWVAYPMHNSVYGVGCNGIGKFKTYIDKAPTKPYMLWKSMLSRCYDEKEQKTHPTYKDVKVSDSWLNFQNFAEWFYSNYNPEYMEGWQLDKDILVKGNKVYSLETCCFVPAIVNSIFTKGDKNRGDYPIGITKNNNNFAVRVSKNGKSVYLGTYKTIEEAFKVYKEAKEEYIKETAEKYKGLISERVYQALKNYTVEITD